MGTQLTIVFPPWGENPTRRGGLRSYAPRPKTFPGWGDIREIHGFPARVRARQARAAPVRASGRSPAFRPRLCPAFGGGFAAVARVTKALQVLWVDKLRPVAIVRHDMVHVGGVHPQAVSSALSAERLAGKLLRPQVVSPDRQAVPAPPAAAVLAAPLHARRPVPLAVAAAHQRCTAWVQAGAQGLTCHSPSWPPAPPWCWR